MYAYYLKKRWKFPKTFEGLGTKLSIFIALLGMVSCSHYEARFPEAHETVFSAEKEVAEDQEKDSVQEAYRYFALSSFAISHGDYEQAKKFLEGALEQDPDSLFLCKRMALILKRLKKYEKALDYALRSAAINPSDEKKPCISGGSVRVEGGGGPCHGLL